MLSSNGPSTIRGSQGGDGSRIVKITDCWYCGKKGHKESEYWKKKADSDKAESSSVDSEHQQRSHYAEGTGHAKTGPTFVMKHKANQMEVGTWKPNEVWHVDFGASNHMQNHEEWFSSLEKPEQPGVVETGDDTAHPIEHIEDIPLSYVGQRGIMRNVLCGLTITKNLVSVGQIVDQCELAIEFCFMTTFLTDRK